MGINLPGVPTPNGYGANGGGGKKRKRKKKGFFGYCWELIMWVFVAFAIVIAIFALPYLFKFSPGDIMAFDDAVGFEKIDAFMDGLRHKQGISEMTFSHDGKSITFTDKNGTLSRVSGEGYDYDDNGEFDSDLEEARRLLREWGLD